MPFTSKRELMDEAKGRGLKGFSTMGKKDIIKLLALDNEGRAPAKNMTVRRKKEITGKIRKSKKKRAKKTLPPLTMSQMLKLSTMGATSTFDPSASAFGFDAPKRKTMKISPVLRAVGKRTIKIKIKPTMPKRLSKAQKHDLMFPDDSHESMSQQQINNLLRNMTKSDLLKIAKERRVQECAKYKNLEKKSIAQLNALL